MVTPRVRHHILLSVLVEHDGDNWIVHSLEHEFAAHGPTREAALNALGRTITAHLRLAQPADKSDPLADVPPAPMEFWEAWERASHREALRKLTPALDDYPPAYVAQAILDAENGDSATR